MKKSLSFEIVTPEGKVYADQVAYAILPGTEGELEVLPGHMPLLTAIKPGEIIVSRSGHREMLAVDKGFARVLADHLSILTEAAINVENINLETVEHAKIRAEKALNEAKNQPNIDSTELERLESVVRFSLVQKLAKKRKY